MLEVRRLRPKTLLFAIIVTVASFTILSCALGYQFPPPTAEPGYVTTHGGVQLVFDSDIGLYVVTGYPDYYYYRGYYYRAHPGGRYERSRAIEGRWRSVDPGRLPPGLVRKYNVHPPEERIGGQRREHRRH
jgi:hypothetical protein